jgi:hypothetical protein
MYLGEIEWGHVNWINFPQNREKGQDVLNIIVNLWILKNFRLAYEMLLIRDNCAW